MEHITSYARRRLDRGLKIATVNRELQVLRRMFVLAMEWGKVERVLPRVRMIPGETRRDRVISMDEEKAYFEAAQSVGTAILEAYERALTEIRATLRGKKPIKSERAAMERARAGQTGHGSEAPINGALHRPAVISGKRGG